VELTKHRQGFISKELPNFAQKIIERYRQDRDKIGKPGEAVTEMWQGKDWFIKVKEEGPSSDGYNPNPEVSITKQYGSGLHMRHEFSIHMVPVARDPQHMVVYVYPPHVNLRKLERFVNPILKRFEIPPFKFIDTTPVPKRRTYYRWERPGYWRIMAKEASA